MLFNSTLFLFIYLPVVLLLYWTGVPGLRVVRTQRQKLMFLAVASYIFYANWDWRFIFLLFGVTAFSYWSGARLHAAQVNGDEAGRKRWLWIGVSGPLLVLAYFKYASFFAVSLQGLADSLNLGLTLPAPHPLLPVGISFYTFQALSYIIDLYRRQVGPADNFLQLTTYIALFPQLIAGPIVRWKTMAPQLQNLPDKLADHRIYNGLLIFVLGLAKKLLIADSIAHIINPLLADYATLQFIGSWGVMLGYTFQIYFDFSAYSEMAVGLGHWLGLDLPINFNRPYRSHNISEFWTRWHITLSSWLRDYLYISLGGNRKGQVRTLLNLVITMFLGGLWHGAGWTFVLWGLFHGMLLVIHHTTRHLNLIRWRPLSWLLTFVAVIFGWVLFRSTTFDMAATLTGSMLGLRGFEGLAAIDNVLGLRLVGLIAICAFVEWRVPAIVTLGLQPGETLVKGQGPRGLIVPALQLVGLVLLFVAAVLSLDQAQQFLYFQF